MVTRAIRFLLGEASEMLDLTQEDLDELLDANPIFPKEDA